jgi:hypothetical protein
MSFVQTSLQVLPAANDATTFYVAMQPFASGKTYEKYVSPDLTFNPNTNQFALNGTPISKNKVTTSATAPLNPNVGDIWYDSTTDVIFRYTFDGENYYWIDISSSALPTNFNYGGFSVASALIATAGATSSVTVTQNQAITSFYPFSSVSGGVTPYTYYVSSGTLPSGVTINSATGLVSGTPTASQSLSNVVFAVKDVNNVIASTTVTVGFTVNSASFSLNYLVVAGGGAGAYSPSLGFAGGGGGAGGMLTGTVSSLTPGIPIVVTVGGGGAAATPANGTNSIIVSPFFSTVTSIGGGRGGGQIPTALTGAPGGSGGGSYWTQVGGTGTPGQGYPGGNYPAGGSPCISAAGGGGAGAAGSAGTPANVGGFGGAGLYWPYNGVKYAGGGGGGGNCGGGLGGNAPPSSPACKAGGGNGAAPATPTGTPGGTNTGGGGGGANYGQPGQRNGGAGGPGIVIFAIPTPSYPGSAPGATVTCAPPTYPGVKLITFTSSGSYTT